MGMNCPDRLYIPATIAGPLPALVAGFALLAIFSYANCMHYSPLRIIITFIITIVMLLVVIEAVRLIILYRSVKSYKSYWQTQIAKPIKEGDFVYLALGDSVAQGIGATDIKRTYVSLIAAHIEQITGRHVHIINVSVTGATATDVVRDQLPQIKGLTPDLVTLDIGANDINHKTSTADFMRDFTTILNVMPQNRSIVADVPIFGDKQKQAKIDSLNVLVIEAISKRGLERAPIADITHKTVNDLSTYGADFFHPGNKGYRNWYRAFFLKLDGIIQK